MSLLKRASCIPSKRLIGRAKSLPVSLRGNMNN
nr:MAG TPA: hypothetical protein [Caudoviricetes sp.]